MSSSLRLLPAGALLLAVGLAGAPAALAAPPAPCDAYSQGCVPDQGPLPDGGGDGGTTTGDGGATGTDTGTGTGGGAGTVSAESSGSSLPFTGGEVTLLGLAGLGAVAGGTALVVAARRRTA